MTDFNFEEAIDGTENEIFGTNEEGELNIFSNVGVISILPYEAFPDTRIKVVAEITQDVAFGLAGQASDNNLTRRDSFELVGSVVGSVVGGFFGAGVGSTLWTAAY